MKKLKLKLLGKWLPVADGVKLTLMKIRYLRNIAYLVLVGTTLSLLFLPYAAFAGSSISGAAGTFPITIGGSLRFRGEFKHNTKDQLDNNMKDSLHGSKNDDHDAQYDSRIRLNVAAKAADNVKGDIQLETGISNTKDVYIWGTSSPGATGIYKEGNAKKGALVIRKAWIWYNHGPVALKIGHQLLAIGNKLFFDHSKYGDDAIAVIGHPTNALTVEALTAKLREGSSNLNDDSDTYMGIVVYKAGNFNMSGDVTYINDLNPPPVTTTSSQYTTTAYTAIHLWNIGIRGDTKLADFTLRGDVELQTGKFANALTGKNIKGYAFLGGIDYKLTNTKLTLETAYGSGDKNDKPTGDSYNTFITTLGSQVHYTYVYDYRTITSAGRTGTGIANTWYTKFGASHKVTKNLSAKAAVFLLRAAKAVNIQALQGKPGASPSKDLGWEVDGKVIYRLARNLNYWIEGGYLFTGKAYDYATASADNVYAIRNGIQFSF